MEEQRALDGEEEHALVHNLQQSGLSASVSEQQSLVRCACAMAACVCGAKCVCAGFRPQAAIKLHGATWDITTRNTLGSL